MTDSIVRTLRQSDYSVDVDVARFRGLRHPPMPDDVESVSGWIVQDRDGNRTPDAQILSLVLVRRRPVLWLSGESDAARADPGRSGARVRGLPTREVLDAVLLPPLGEGEHLRLGRCFDAQDRHVVAQVVWEPNQPVLRDVRYAWRPEPQGFLTEIDPEGVRCRVRVEGPDRRASGSLR